MLVGLELDPHFGATLEALGDETGRDALAGATVRLIADGGDQQVSFVANFATRRGDRIGARRESPGHRAQLIGGKRDRECLDQIDQLAADDPVLGLAVGDQLLQIVVAGLRHIGLDRLERQSGHIARFDKFITQLCVAGKSGQLEQLIDIGGVVLRIEIERVTRLVGWRRAFKGKRKVHGFLVGARRVEIGQFGDFGLDDVGIRRTRRFRAKVDFDDAAAVDIDRRRQNLDSVAQPVAGRLFEIEIAIDPIDNALRTERGETFVDLLTDGAEFNIGRVAERQNAKLDPVEARRTIAH